MNTTKRNFNYKILVLIIVILAMIAEIAILLNVALNDKENELSNNYILNDMDDFSKYAIEEQEAEFEKEINDTNTVHYIIEGTSDNSVALEYAYVTPEYTKIKFTYEIPKEDYNTLPEEEKEKFMSQIMNKQMDIAIKEDHEGYPYIETINGKKIVPQRTDDSDGGRGIDSNTGICTWYDTFPLTIKDVTDSFTLCFLNEMGNEVKIELRKNK